MAAAAATAPPAAQDVGRFLEGGLPRRFTRRPATRRSHAQSTVKRVPGTRFGRGFPAVAGAACSAARRDDPPGEDDVARGVSVSTSDYCQILCLCGAGALSGRVPVCFYT